MSHHQHSNAAPVVATGVAHITSTDYRGFSVIDLLAQEKANNPNWSRAPDWYNIKLADGGLSNQANCILCDVTANSGFNGDHPFDARATNQTFAISPPAHPGRLFEQGLPYNDAVSFGSNVTLADIPRFIAQCNASYADAVARGDANAWQLIPAIQHDVGPVAE